MSYALSSGVTGLQAHQKMLDVAGNNLANVNTTSFKSSSISFSELLGQTLQDATQPTDQIGGTDPLQMGSGVGVSSITPNMTQGSIVNTGNPLDMAIEGEGYFVVDSSEGPVYTRAGMFGVDESGYLVDPATGYRVQRMGLTGESDGFQITGDSSIRIPYDVALPARMTSEITITGNCSSDATPIAQAQVLVSEIDYTYNGGTDASDTVEIDQLDQFSGGSGVNGELGAGETGTITIAGYDKDGDALSSGLTFTVSDTTTLGDFISHLNTNVLNGATASIANGQICITDDETGYSKSDISLSYSGDGSLTTPAYFEVPTVGGDEVKNINIAIFDSLGGKHVLSAALVRTDTINTWDLVLTSVTGDVSAIGLDNRRVNGIQFDPETGAFSGIPLTETAEFTMTFGHDTTHPQSISLDFGTIGSFDGLTQFAGTSTAVARDQDGYDAGSLSTVSVNGEGVLIGAFSNGIKKDLATIQIATFNNPAGLQNMGGGYFASSANSGGAVAVQAQTAGAGSVQGSALEKSNADVATEFVNLIQAQNGFQANARTITVANQILQELTNLIR
ncbi:MAG: flagellar hook-basal body complex protein [Sedimentisphaerales bacterium]|nr:flagellar hook-basal body complex protein [Sedimentisphaerales bacterium]